MSEYTPQQYNYMEGVLCELLGIPQPLVLRLSVVAVVCELLGEWQAAACRESDLAERWLRLEDMLAHFLRDVPTTLDTFFNEAMHQALWLAAYHHPWLGGRPREMVTSSRCSSESVLLCLAMCHWLESTQRETCLYQGCTLEEVLGVCFATETCGGGAMEYVEFLFESA